MRERRERPGRGCHLSEPFRSPPVTTESRPLCHELDGSLDVDDAFPAPTMMNPRSDGANDRQPGTDGNRRTAPP